MRCACVPFAGLLFPILMGEIPLRLKTESHGLASSVCFQNTVRQWSSTRDDFSPTGGMWQLFLEISGCHSWEGATSIWLTEAGELLTSSSATA